MAARPTVADPFVPALVVLIALVTAGCAVPAPRVPPTAPAAPAPPAPGFGLATVQLELVAARVVPWGQALPCDLGFRVGGLSGCALDESTGRVLAVSDDRDQPRVFDLDIRVEGDALSVVVAAVVRIEDRDASAGDRRVVDMEGIAVTGPDRWLISSEGDRDDWPAAPPALSRHRSDGSLVGWLPVPEMFLPNPPDAAPRGVRPNRAFESLTRAPDGRVVTASEGPLAQDAALPDFGESVPVRLLEYVPTTGSWRPGRQFAYALSPVALPVGFGPGTLATGVAELLALDEDRLLVLERSYVSERTGLRRGGNVVRLFEVSLRGADDVSSVASLRERSVRPLAKRLVLDLDTLRPRLAGELPTLENFEAMCRGPRLPDGSSTLLLISDDNFNRRQKTAFLLFRVG